MLRDGGDIIDVGGIAGVYVDGNDTRNDPARLRLLDG